MKLKNKIYSDMSIGLVILMMMAQTGLAMAPAENINFVAVEKDSDLVTILKNDSANPFSNAAKISFHLNDTVSVCIEIKTPLGRTVRELLAETLQPGIHTFTWDGKDNLGNPVDSGVFIYEIKTEKVTRSEMLALLY